MEITRGDFIRLSGPNGCGKTSLLRILAGLVPSIYPGILKGKILYMGQELGPDRKIPGICLTGPWAASRLFCRTVWEEISFSPSADKAEAEQLMEYFGLEDLKDCHPQNLSGGQQQLVLLCAYLSCQPRLLLLDECFAQLSESKSDLLVKLLKYKHAEGNTIIMVEHKLPEALRNSVSSYSINTGSIHSLKRQNRQNFLLKVSDASKSSKDVPYLETRNLIVKTESGISLQYKNIALHSGMILHIHGPIGSGKSTLIRSLLSLGHFQGEIYYGGVPIKKMKRRTLTAIVSAVLQSPDSQFFSNTVRNEIHYTARLLGRRVPDFLDLIINDLGLAECLDRHPFTLSQGEKKKCQLVASLASNPKILLLDEPDAGLDETSTAQLMELLIKLLNKGLIILFTSHNQNFVSSISRSVPRFHQYCMKENVHGL